MNNVDYFLEAVRHAYPYREWVLSVFMVTTLPKPGEGKHYKGRLYDANGYVGFMTSDFNLEMDESDTDPTEKELTLILFNGKPIPIEGRTEPLLYVDETIKVTPDDIDSVTEPSIETTPGTVFVNWYCFMDTIGAKHPFEKGPNISVGKIAQKLSSHVVDDVPPEQEEKDKIYVHQFKKMLNAMASLSGFTIINSPSATEFTVQQAPGTDELKEQLFEKYKDHLDDPATIIKIEKELIQHDKDFINQDPNKGFYIKGKSFNVSRKKLHIMQGLQKRMDDTKPAVLIKGALNGELNQADIPAMIDGAREGSFNRGAATALGGESVKFIYRIYGASEIIKEDCGTKLGIPKYISPNIKASAFIGTYIIEGSKLVLLTEDNISNYVGKTVICRSPAFCLAGEGGRGYCSKCFGEKMRGYEQSLASYGAMVGSVMNTRFMKSMHGTSGDTKKLILDEAIS